MVLLSSATVYYIFTEGVLNGSEKIQRNSRRMKLLQCAACTEFMLSGFISASVISVLEILKQFVPEAPHCGKTRKVRSRDSFLSQKKSLT